jgi:hypothetical protein
MNTSGQSEYPPTLDGLGFARGFGERLRSQSDPGKIQTESKIRKWFQDLTRLNT